jgi:hypothetical protein
MSSVFIVRPFGTKAGVDFDGIEAQLIQPAMRKAGLRGSTTTEIFESGSIQEDMFRLLVSADLVIADVSIHNANVFYELGIRHGLRPRATFMINAEVDQFPFDIQGDRYLAYDKADPAASVDALARGLKATVDSERTDSPVYRVLPELPPPDPAALRIIPSDFTEEVERARANEERGDLRLLAYEARDFSWGSEGLRVVGRAQFDLKAWQGAIETFEWLRDRRTDHIEANQRLATAYQKVGDRVRSNQAVARVIESKIAHRSQRAEALALLASNTKVLWRADFKGLATPEAQRRALQDVRLAEAAKNYASGYSFDLNHFYSGLNAMSLLCIRIGLAEALPQVWGERFEEDDEAARELKVMKQQFDQLSGSVAIALKAAREHLEKQEQRPDEWARISEADYAFLTSNRPAVVAQRYKDAIVGASDFAQSAARAQIEIFSQLGLRKEFVDATLDVIPASAEDAATNPQRKRVILCTGHMVDSPNRKSARFPNTKAAEAEAARMIAEAVQREQELAPEGIIGIAGGACGADILFHEICEKAGIETRLMLALPRTQFCATSVQHGGPEWVERYNRLCDRKKPRVLAETEELPRWLRSKADYSIWQRNNLWILFNALSMNALNLTLIALWDGGVGDGPGGTEHLVAEVEARGLKKLVLPAAELKRFAA